MTNDDSRSGRMQLRLYVAGPDRYTCVVQQRLARFAESLGIDYELELIDVRREPERAQADVVVTTPALIKLFPAPRAMVIGDLEDKDELCSALGVRRS